MSDSDKAVFLSYASQDVEAAHRIADALRAAGVEVWFDKSELRGGDAWDAKLRRQIKECALFVPIITPTTNARAEGYFRLEWKLAVDRSHLMADDAHFLFPIVVGDVADATARVPDKFRDVQWTRLRLDETPAELGTRVAKILSGGAVEERGQRTEDRGGRRRREEQPKWLRYAWMGVGLVFALVFAIRPLFQSDRRREPKPSVVAPAAAGEAAQLTARAYAVTLKVGFTREELATAETLMQQAVELEPNSAHALSVRAWVHACYLMRNWDVSDRRLQEVQAEANRALALDPNDADALNALGMVLEKQRVPVEAEKISRRAVAAAPDNYRSRLLLGRALRGLGRTAESREVMQEAVRRFPDNVLCRYELAASYASVGMLGEALTPANVAASIEQLDAAIATQPFASAIIMKAVLEAAGYGDLPAMRAELNRLETMPLADRTEDRAVFIAMWGGLLEKRPERVLAIAKLTARPYFEDLLVAGPKAWGTALAYRQAGKDALAHQEWLAAEAVMRQRQREQPNELDNVRLATTLAWVGDNAEADRLIAPTEAAWREDLTKARARDLARYYAARGDAGKAVPYLRQVLNFNSFLTDHVLPVDPWWDKLHGAPEFEALLAEAKARTTATAAAAPRVEEKSVAVLAFANLSDDKANEYFSDGISEELLNVLAKVPGLKVTARTSSFHFKGTNTAIPEIAQQLGVAYVIEGSVRKQGDKVRITAQLIKASDGFHVWSDTFTRDLKDIFAVQDEIAGLIAKQLSLKLETSSPAATASVKPEAFELYVQARQAIARRDVENFDRAEQLLGRALELEPGLARAHAALADVWTLRANLRREIGYFGQREAPVFSRVEAEIAKALDLDPDSAEAHASLGFARLHEWKLADAERELRRAVALNPNYPTGHHWLAACLINIGWIDEGLAEYQRAAELDPFSFRILENYGSALGEAGRREESLAYLNRALQLQPKSTQALANKAITLSELNRRSEAIAIIRELPESNARFLFAGAGLQAEAEAALAKATGRDRNSLLAGLDRYDEWLDAITPADINVFGLRGLLLFEQVDPIRRDPRFTKLIATLGVTEAHARAQAWRQAHPPEKPGAKK